MEQLTEQLTLRLSKSTLDAAKKLAEKEQRKLADLLRRLVELGLSVRKS